MIAFVRVLDNINWIMIIFYPFPRFISRNVSINLPVERRGNIPVMWLACDNIPAMWLACDNISAMWLACDNIPAMWLACDNIPAMWLACDNIPVMWLARDKKNNNSNQANNQTPKFQCSNYLAYFLPKILPHIKE